MRVSRPPYPPALAWRWLFPGRVRVHAPAKIDRKSRLTRPRGRCIIKHGYERAFDFETPQSLRKRYMFCGRANLLQTDGRSVPPEAEGWICVTNFKLHRFL